MPSLPCRLCPAPLGPTNPGAAVRCSTQLVAIITNGHENSSCRFSKEEIAAMVIWRDEGDWTFMFPGADIDAFSEAAGVGVGADCSAGHDGPLADRRRERES